MLEIDSTSEQETLETRLEKTKKSLFQKNFKELVDYYAEQFGEGLNKSVLARYLSSVSNKGLYCVRAWIRGEGTPNKKASLRLRTLIASKKEGRLNDLHDTFSRGLVPVEQLPDIEQCVRVLGFQDYQAMVKAICEATDLNYGSVHRIKYGQKRVRVEIKHCLDNWMSKLQKGENPEINPEYLVVSSDEFRDKMYAAKKLLRKPVLQISRDLAPKVYFSPKTISHYFARRVNFTAPRLAYNTLVEMMNNSSNQAPSNPSA